MAITYTNSLGTPLDLDDGTTYTLEMIRGIYQPPSEPVYTTIPRKLPVGIYQVHNMAVRRIGVDLVVKAASPSALLTAVKALYAHIYIDIRDEAKGTLDYTDIDSVRLLCKAVPDSIPSDTDTVADWFIPGSTGSGMARVTIDLLAPDPTFYVASSTAVNGSFNGVVQVNLSCINVGNENAYPTITLDADTANPIEDPVITDVYGNTLTIEETIDAGETLTLALDPSELAFTYTGAPVNWFGKRASGSQLVSVKYGTNNLAFTAANVAADGDISIQFNSRYGMFGS